MRDTPLRQHIFQALREHPSLHDLSDDKLNGVIFKHPASNRLSYQGFLFVKREFDCYSFAMDCSLNGRQLISLTRGVVYPYYIGTTQLTLFSREDAVLLKLYSSDIRAWLDNL